MVKLQAYTIPFSWTWGMPTKIDSLFPFNIVLEILASTQMTRTQRDIKMNSYIAPIHLIIMLAAVTFESLKKNNQKKNQFLKKDLNFIHSSRVGEGMTEEAWGNFRVEMFHIWIVVNIWLHIISTNSTKLYTSILLHVNYISIWGVKEKSIEFLRIRQ